MQNFIKIISLSVLLAFSVFGQVYASPSLAFSFTDFLKEAKDTTKNILPDTQVVQNLLATTTKKVITTTGEEKTACEYFDDAILKTIGLEISSEDAKQKIEKFEEVLEGEVLVRDGILSSVKNLFGLQKKDKVIFREMKKDILEAKKYYADLDLQLDANIKTILETVCEDEKKEVIQKFDEKVEDTVLEESIFRKQLVGGLRDRMKILEEGVKNAKK